jgi:hypothetical protein
MKKSQSSGGGFMLFSRSRVVLFLICIFIFMAAIFVYTDQLIEDQIDRLGEDLLRLQASMVAWVQESFRAVRLPLTQKFSLPGTATLNSSFRCSYH